MSKTATAEVHEPTYTEQIKDARQKLNRRRDRQNEDGEVLATFQRQLDQATDRADDAFDESVASPSDKAAEAYADARREHQRLNLQYQEALTSQKRLPKAIKRAQSDIRQLEQTKEYLVREKAQQLFNKKKLKSFDDASTALVKALSLLGITQNNRAINEAAVNGLVSTLTSGIDFRLQIGVEFDKLKKTLDEDSI